MDFERGAENGRVSLGVVGRRRRNVVVDELRVYNVVVIYSCHTPTIDKRLIVPVPLAWCSI